MRSEPIISTAEHSPIRPPQAAQIAQPQPPGAAPVSAQSAETQLPPDAVMSRPGATIVAQAETSPMPALSFAELSVTPANATAEILPPIQPRIDHAPRVIQVIAEAARALQDRPVEVTLNPEELGRVRLTLRSVDGSMSVSVAVERPETLDLLRRNIDMLASQLRELGYKDLSFSFAGHGESFGSSEEHRGDHELPTTDEPQEPPHPSPMQLSVTDTGGIDIRL